MITMHHLVFGESNIKPNTFIGVAYSNINALANELNTTISNIKSFKIVDGVTQCFIKENITLNTNTSKAVLRQATFVNDTGNKIVAMVGPVFNSSTALANGVFNGIKSLDGLTFIRTTNRNLNIELLSLEEIVGSGSPFDNSFQPNLNLDTLLRASNNAFTNTIYTDNISIKKCKELGVNGTYLGVFNNTKTLGNLDCNVFLKTRDNGKCDGDILYMFLNRDKTVNFYDDDLNFIEKLAFEPNITLKGGAPILDTKAKIRTRVGVDKWFSDVTVNGSDVSFYLGRNGSNWNFQNAGITEFIDNSDILQGQNELSFNGMFNNGTSDPEYPLKKFYSKTAHYISTGQFARCYNMEVIDAKRCKSIGDNLTHNTTASPFLQMAQNVKIHVNIILKTITNGGLNPELAYAKNELDATIYFYDDNGNYVSTL